MPLFTTHFTKKLSALKSSIVLVLLFFSSAYLSAQAPFIVVLGVAQDAGFPQIGCKQDCCKAVLAGKQKKKMVTSIALADPVTKNWWLFEATPDIAAQIELFHQKTKNGYGFLPTAIFMTHAHIGHYTGLMYLGREALNTNNQQVFALPKMKAFLENNAPWSQLTQIRNIQLTSLAPNQFLLLNNSLYAKAFLVPHRDEFSETVGFEIKYQNKTFLFIPDIDKWNKFSNDIAAFLQQADKCFIDATFYKEGEIKARAMHEIPHPFVQETKLMLKGLSATEKKKIVFIHFNHTNPLLNKQSDAFKETMKEYDIAEQGRVYSF